MPFATEDFPFDEYVLAVRVGGKIFTLIPLNNPGRMNLKCDPEKAIELREKYEGIEPGYHMNKATWNTVNFGQLPASLVKQLIIDSYDLILKSLTRKVRENLS